MLHNPDLAVLDRNNSLATHSHNQQQLRSDYKVKYGGDSTYSQEKIDLHEERRKLLDSLTHSMSDSSHLEKDVSRLQQETQITGYRSDWAYRVYMYYKKYKYIHMIHV